MRFKLISGSFCVCNFADVDNAQVYCRKYGHIETGWRMKYYCIEEHVCDR